MKKLLALVLALVMTLSLCTISNAAFTDAKDVDASYEEAVAVLNGMGVFKGYEDGSFKPEGSITRAEVAAIVYRLYTGDVKDKQAGLYAGYGKFDDMAGAAWATGYIGFCANAGFVKGYGDGKFGPSDPVTGYQALAMILRAVGYGKNGEFEGADWELHVAQIAQQVGALKNVKGVSLKAAASRQLVAELLFQVAAYVPTVTYTPAFGYVTADIAKDVKDETLGWKNFNLAKDEAYGDDAWGRPAYVWFSENGKNATADNAKYTKNTDDIYATIAAKPVMTFTEATSECDICEELGESKEAEVESVWTNGVKANHDALSATATKKTVGDQGQLVEIYDGMGEDEDEYRMVIIDTYLAKVTSVTAEKVDKNGHVTRDAYLTLEVYRPDNGPFTLYVKGNDYEKGDYVLVNVNAEDDNYVTITGLGEKALVEVVGVAESKDAVQTKVHYNSGKHTIDGTDYMDAVNFILDEAQKNGTKAFTWFFDQYGNVIGSIAIDDVYNYGVVTYIEKFDAVGEADYVVADITYVNGEEAEAVKVASIKKDDAEYIYGVDYNGKYNEYLNGYYYDDDRADDIKVADHLFRIDTNKDGELLLVDTAETFGAIAKKGTTVGDAKIDDATVFMIRTGDGTTKDPYQFEFVTGKNNIGDYEKQDVHYVNGSDGYADYVYIIGDAVPEISYKFVFIAGKSYTENLRDDVSGVKYTQFNSVVNMDGSDAELKVKDAADNARELKDALLGEGNLKMVEITDGYVTEVTNIGYDGCAITLPKGDKLQALSALTDADSAKIAEGVEFHDLDNVDIGEVNYNMTDVTVLLDGEEVAANAYLTDDALKYEGVKTVYVVRSSKANEEHLAATVVLSTTKNIQVCPITDPCTVTVDGVKVAEVPAGTEIVAKDYKVGNGTGVKVGDKYYAYDEKIIVNTDTAIETGYVAWTLNGETTKPVPYGTEEASRVKLEDVFTVSGTYVKATWEGGGNYYLATTGFMPEVDHAFEDGFYTVSETDADNLITIVGTQTAKDGKVVAKGEITVENATNDLVKLTVNGVEETLSGKASTTVTVSRDTTIEAETHG